MPLRPKQNYDRALRLNAAELAIASVSNCTSLKKAISKVLYVLFRQTRENRSNHRPAACAPVHTTR